MRAERGWPTLVPHHVSQRITSGVPVMRPRLRVLGLGVALHLLIYTAREMLGARSGVGCGGEQSQGGQGEHHCSSSITEADGDGDLRVRGPTKDDRSATHAHP